MTPEDLYLCLTILVASFGAVIIWNDLIKTANSKDCDSDDDDDKTILEDDDTQSDGDISFKED